MSPNQVAAQRDSIPTHADVLEVDGSAVVQVGEALQQQHGSAVGHLQDGRGVCVGGDRLDGQGGGRRAAGR